MTNKENRPLMESKNNIGPFSNCASLKPQKEGFIEAICEICDKIFTTDKDIYICPECLEKNNK